MFTRVKQSQRRGALLFALAATLVASRAPAVRADGALPGGRSWAVGTLVVTSPSPFAGHSTQVLPVPFVAYFGERLSVLGPQANYRVYQRGALLVSANASFRWEGFEAEKSSFLAGMDQRKGALELGLGVGFGPFSLDASSDVSGIHKGQELTFTIGLPLHQGNHWGLEANVGASYKSHRLVDYYYGVRSSEARLDRAAYTGESAFNFATGVDLSWQMNWNWILMGGVQIERLSGKITDSPIVEDRYAISGQLGVMRMF